MNKILIMVAAAIFVSGCALFEPDAVVIGCPQIHQWTTDQQKEWATELRQWGKQWAATNPGGPPSMINLTVLDYSRMVEESRSCQGHQSVPMTSPTLNQPTTSSPASPSLFSLPKAGTKT